MKTNSIRSAWLFSTLLGACLWFVVLIVSQSFGGFVIGAALACVVYCVAFHGLCLHFIPGIDKFIVKEDYSVNGSTHTTTTHFRTTGDPEFDKYLKRYVEARQHSSSALAGLVMIVIIASCALAAH